MKAGSAMTARLAMKGPVGDERPDLPDEVEVAAVTWRRHPSAETWAPLESRLATADAERESRLSSRPNRDTEDILPQPPAESLDAAERSRTAQLRKRSVAERSPFTIGLTGGLGLAVAYVVYRMVVDVSTVLMIVGLSLFIAMGLSPVVEWLVARKLPRLAAVLLVALMSVLVVAGFVAAALSPLSHEVHQLSRLLPRYREEISSGQGWVGRLAVRLHLNTYVSSQGGERSLLTPNISWVGGLLGAGKLVVSAVSATLIVVVLTFYFLLVLPSIRQLWLRCFPASRRQQAGVYTDEVLAKVSGFVLGNILTSIIAGVGTTLWLAAFRVRYAVLLGLMVAILDLIPIIGSTVGGLICSLVALSRGLPIALATAAFYIVYRFLEDHLLTPLVMRRTVQVSAGVTIIATLVGGSLLGIIGALVAIPVAATIHLLLEDVAFRRLDHS